SPRVRLASEVILGQLFQALDRLRGDCRIGIALLNLDESAPCAVELPVVSVGDAQRELCFRKSRAEALDSLGVLFFGLFEVRNTQSQVAEIIVRDAGVRGRRVHGLLKPLRRISPFALAIVKDAEVRRGLVRLAEELGLRRALEQGDSLVVPGLVEIEL